MGISEYSDCIPIGILLIIPFALKRNKLLLAYLVSFQGLHFLSLYTALVDGNNNMWVYKLLGLTELILISLWYFSFRKTIVLKLLFFLVLAFYALLSYSNSPMNLINSLALSLSTFFLISLSLTYMFWLYESNQTVNIVKFFPFWVNGALLIYLSSSFFAYLFSYQALFNTPDMNDFFRYTWVFHSMGNILKCIVLSVGLIVCRKSFKENTLVI